MLKDSPIYFKFLSHNSHPLRGFLTTNPMLKSQVLIVGEDDYLVKQSYLLKFVYYVSVNKLSIYRNEAYINSPKKIKDFINGIGLNSLQEFMNCFYKQPNYHKGTATILLYYNQLTELDPFY